MNRTQYHTATALDGLRRRLQQIAGLLRRESDDKPFGPTSCTATEGRDAPVATGVTPAGARL
jgi:hypothetical protein